MKALLWKNSCLNSLTQLLDSFSGGLLDQKPPFFSGGWLKTVFPPLLCEACRQGGSFIKAYDLRWLWRDWPEGKSHVFCNRISEGTPHHFCHILFIGNRIKASDRSSPPSKGGMM